ncbi:anaphase-promoting complex subunit 1 isoform X1 [Anastrepha ludens]|uniref:anaphase-promoting complex subunit 1 isoform X1 n=1 Tax=Anastrepha ludens TaxID=28586 RepID=UPI0023B03169|nr:anaphase-promoting complex subunit 1 isoform X1 [Anastrepha ludens]
MIAASEPLAFIPRGRQAVEEHPGPTDVKQQNHLPTEHVLLQRMQNVNISASDEPNEFWCVREIFEDLDEDLNRVRANQCNEEKDTNKKKPEDGKASRKDGSRISEHLLWQQRAAYTDVDYMCEYLVNSEEELYVKKHTAVWSKGLLDENSIMPRLCFTCETPIKFAFFCNKSFVTSKRNSRAKNKSDKRKSYSEEEEDFSAICLIDQVALRIYCSNGEDFLCNLEFPVSHVWPTSYGILLEKVPSNAVIQNHAISMPRLFSLAHPLDEICPVLCKTEANSISYLVESDYNIIFTSENSELVLLYDNKTGKQFISRLRKATEEEIQYVGAQNESAYTGTAGGLPHHSINRGSGGGIGAIGTPKHSTAHLGRSGLANPNYSAHIGRFLSSAHSLSGAFGNSNRTASPLNHLQSTIGQHSISTQDIRKLGQAQPSKPIVPELCLEHIWTENACGNNREFGEISTRAFMHTDLVGQTYLCYLLPFSCKLHLIRLLNYGTADLQISSKHLSIPAKDAVALERLRMIAVLDPSGSLILYTGAVLVSKVHVAAAMGSTSVSVGAGNVTPTPATTKTLAANSPNSPFPRRSSLLPTIQKPTDTTFDEELHLLSPVHPLQPQFPNRNTSNICLSLRDPAGNRLTLVYPFGKMYRIELPQFNETKFISRCIGTLRRILNKEQFVQLITRWYGARNPPGSRDYSIEQEWHIFRNVLTGLMGCGAATHETTTNASMSSNAEEPKKRRKNDEITEGTDEDWEFMLDVLNEDGSGGCVRDNMKMETEQGTAAAGNVDANACLFNSIPAIFYGLHLLYEDFKLDETMHDCLPYLAKFLQQFAVDMQLTTYIFHYTLDFPYLVHCTTKLCQLTEEHAARMAYKELLQVPAPSVYRQLEHILKGKDALQYTFVEGLNDMSRNVLQVVSLIMHGTEKIKDWIKPLEFANSVQSYYPKRPKRFISTIVPRAEQVIQMLINMEITRADIARLPVALHLIIAECLEHARLTPPIGCSAATYELILRTELVAHALLQDDSPTSAMSRQKQKVHVNAEDSLSARCPPATNGISHMEAALDDGMDNIDTKLLNLRFPDDMRIAEVRRLLTSSEPVLIDIVQKPGMTDHRFIEEQERQLFALCKRTMALPLGRGMFTLRTSIPTPTELMPIPKLCLSGKEPVKGATIEMQQIELPPNMSLWPSFHNGVAAGLKISRHARDVDSTWIVYNKPKGQEEISTEHAGFLMALGLNGHLKTLSFMSVYEYLVKCDEMTSVGLLLGISATHRGTMDNTTTKLLSVHIEALLPTTALELDIPQNIQVASLMGIGLLYQGSAKRHIAEVLLQEVGRPPGPEMENSIERESYALTAGLALGLVTLGLGESPAGLLDLQIPDTLHYYMVGGNKRQLTGSQKEKYKLPSFQVREGDNVNIDVTAPGATLALGLMFFNTNNRAVAEWMNPPNTHYLLDLVRPDLLMLRTIARGLILWSDIKPDAEWLFGQFPSNFKIDLERPYYWGDKYETSVDYESEAQAWCNVIAGASFCMGLKYAGSENQEAFKTLHKALKKFIGFQSKHVFEFAGYTTVECCLMVILIAISLVFAGSGDLEILRIIRYLRSRISFRDRCRVNYNPNVTFGSQMAIHMSLGLLFLGAGRYTIANTPEAVAALICAFFPKFPNHSNDNRYHLQAFRHLYVLAVEPRLFLPRDIDTKKLCLCQISVLEIGSKELRRLPMAPCMLPPLNTLQKVIVDDANYWPVCFEKERNWSQLIKALQSSACIDIKKRSGCLSHLEDPDRLKSLFAQTLTTEQYTCWHVNATALERFSNDPFVTSFTDRFLHIDSEVITPDELLKIQQLTMLFYNAVIKDKMHVLPIYLTTFNLIQRLQRNPQCNDVWQIKLIDLYMEKYEQPHILLTSELMRAQLEKFKMFIENTRRTMSTTLRHFISASSFEPSIITDFSAEEVARLLAVVNYYNLTPNLLNLVDLSGTVNYIRYLYEFKKLNLDMQTMNCMIKILLQTRDEEAA